MTLIIVIAVVALLVLWVISIQNKLVKSDEICNNALKQINVQQVSRYDALQALVKLTREYASYEADTLQKVIEARKITSSPAPTPAEINANEQALTQIAGRLLAVAEQYPELKANENYKELMNELSITENKIAGVRIAYNNQIRAYNKYVRRFPHKQILGIMGYTVIDYKYLEYEENEKAPIRNLFGEDEDENEDN